MKKFKFPFKTFLTIILVCGGLGFSSCSEKDSLWEEEFTLFYPTVSEICPGTNLTVSPTWRGDAPNGFTIERVLLNGETFETECFSVKPENGVFSIMNSESLAVGLYSIDISCVFNGQTYHFEKAVEIEMMKPVPDGITVEPDQLATSLASVITSSADTPLPTARIVTDGNNHVKIQRYLIANVYLDGELANRGKDWFALSDDGVFSIVPDNAGIEPGIYTFDFKLTTYIAGSSSEEGLFTNALRLDITSAPSLVTYTPSASSVEYGTAANSLAPKPKGSADGLVYAIKSVSPNNNPQITIDPATGVLTFPATNGTTIGDEYHISLTLTNDYGSTDFENVYKFTVIDFLDPISKFTYADIDESISGVSINNPVAEMDGEDVTYEFVNLPAELSALGIDAVSGVVSCERGVELPIGDYTVTVKATNAKGSENTSFRLNIVANPNHFTYVRWGNNLGENGKALTPLAEYGNQFKIPSNTKLEFPVVEHDIPSGKPVTYEYYRWGMTGGADVHKTTGKATAYVATSSKLVILIVSVTVGEGEAAITRKFPLFFDWYEGTITGGYTINYTPFVFHVNPKTGGTFKVSPVIKKNGEVITGTLLDFTGNAQYLNVGGPDSHTNYNALKNDPTSFLHFAWDRYYEGINKNPVYTARAPMSYYDNYANNQLSFCGGYVTPDNFNIVINPEKFKDDDGNYADGVMFMTMKFKETGTSPHETGGVEANRVFIWFDPDYTE